MQIIIEPYNSNWPALFLTEKEVIASALQPYAPAIEHFGSTAIIGMDAKPIIDILVGLDKADDLDKTVEPMIEAGFTYIKKYEPLWPARRFFMQLKALNKVPPTIIDIDDNVIVGKDYISLANIHIIVTDTHDWVRMIAFRDYLRISPSTRDAYSQLKGQISKQDFNDMNEYNIAKDQFVKQTERLALEWFYRQVGGNK
jgi:GrpB-like predicted nucleotidyltransferase (UPF0157 family)